MCGIVGIIHTKDRPNKDAIDKMAEAILHRGPDEDGFFRDEKVSLGMRRLSIIDLAGGHQPITSADEKKLIFFNGEIYNYKELRAELVDRGYEFKTESDTEVVLATYITFGSEGVGRLRGMFAFAIYDQAEEELFIARDYFGIKPLYYVRDSGRVTAFSSEIKSFFALHNFKPEVNDTAVFNYLSYQYNPLEETFFKGVFKLPPAHHMTVDLRSGAHEIKRYWQFALDVDKNMTEEDAKRAIAETMSDSVSHHMIADVPVGSFLSGGIDSSIIATLMQQVRKETSGESARIKTFTVSFGTVSEGVEARETAEPLGTEHREISVGSEEYFSALPKVLWHFDEPVADPSALGLYFLAREARKEVKVVLSGEGADELFGGYNIYLEPFSRSKIAWIPRPLLKIVAGLPIRGSNYAKRALMRLEERYIGNAQVFTPEEARAMWKGKEEVFSLRDMYSEVKQVSDSAKMQYIDIHTWLVGDILAKADKMTMAHSLELRVPFLDIEVARLAATLPDRLKWKSRITKYALREAFKDVLPESTRQRRKLGFPTPIREWFTRDREDLYKTILDNPYVKEKFEVQTIRELIEAHTSGRADNSRKIYLLLVLALWYNTFITREHS